MKPEAAPNPLAPRAGQMPQMAKDPLEAHARIHHAVQALPDDDLARHAAKANFILPLVGALAANPKVKARDVIKAAAAAVAEGHAEPSEAIKFISSMPSDPEKLRPFLRDLYLENFTGAVHMKAALMRRGMPLPGQTPEQEPQQ